MIARVVLGLILGCCCITVGQQSPVAATGKGERRRITSDELSVYKAALVWFARDGVWQNEKSNRRFALRRNAEELKLEWILKHDKECLKGLELQPSKAASFREEDGFALDWPLLAKKLDDNADHVTLPDYIEFTSVSFDKDKKFAAVGYDSHCGGTCGLGGMLVFRKSDENWTLVSRPCISFAY